MAEGVATTVVRPPITVQLVAAAVVGLAVFTLITAQTGMGPAGWAGGAAFLALAGALVARAAGRTGARSLGPAGTVTALRTVLVGGVTGLVCSGLAGEPLAPGATGVLVAVTGAALALDAVDGPVARRTRTADDLGARFDMEVDAVLLLVLSVHVAQALGVWVLAVGGLRYAFVAAGWVLPWLRGALPPRRSAKVVAALQGVALVVAAADALPRSVTIALVGVALAALVWSFGVSVVWLARRRAGGASEASLPAPSARNAASTDADGAGPGDDPERITPRTVLGGTLTVAAVLLLVVVLVAPHDLAVLVPPAFLRLPVEGIVGLALLLLLPPRARRVLAPVAGAAVGVLAVLVLLDLGFSAVLARPFDPVLDGVLVGNGFEFVSGAVGEAGAVGVAIGAVLAAVALVVIGALAVRRLVRVGTRYPRSALRVVAVLGAVWLVGLVAALDSAPGVPLASATTAATVRDRAEQVRTGVADERAFAAEAGADAWRGVPGPDLLGALRGKDVVVAVVESYGRSALEDPGLAADVGPAVDRADRALADAGWGARSGFLTSSVVGSGSWLAHATLLSGLRIDNEQRYRTLTSSDRLTLSEAFRRGGWDTVAVQPGTTRAWPEGAFYGYGRTYGVEDLGYRGPAFSWATMPDQFALEAFRRLELARPGRAPLMAEVDLVSSHAPWSPLPRMVPPEQLGDGAVFGPMSGPPAPPNAIFTRDPALVRADYARSVAYSLDALTSWVRTSGDDRLVLVVVGDHQPAPVVTGPGAGRDVPISIVTRDRAVLDRVAPWGWTPGMKPPPDAPTWPMEAFRDRFLAAFAS